MVRLQVLGTLDLSSDRGEVSELLGQPKRVALLTFLVLHSTNGPVSRDKLLGLFWPEISESRGRRALSQSLYVLRKSVGEHVIQAVGQDALRLNRELFSCDAIEFQELVEKDDSELALSLYGGDLLDGFFLAGTPQFEQWVDGERSRLNRMATDGARDLATAAEAAGDLLAAARWARRAARLAPWDEASVVRLLELLRDAGDRSGAQQEYDRYRRRLREEMESDPSEAIEAALSSQREGVGTRPREIAQVSAPAVGPPTLVPVPALVQMPAPVSAAAPSRSRRWRTAAILAGVLLLSILFFVRPSGQAFLGDADSSPIPRVLVAPLANETGDADLDPVGRLAADWLAGEIARTGRIRVVPPVSVLRLISREDVEGDTTVLGRAVAAGTSTRAQLVLGGYVTGRRDSTVFEVFGLDPQTGEIVFSLQPVGPTGDQNSNTLDRLRKATIGALAGQLDERMRRWTGPASQPPSYESYQEYSQAMDTFLGGSDWATQGRAAEQFLAAWQADTAFTAPLIWGIFALFNSGQGDRADSVAHALEAHANSLAAWDLAMLRYHLAYLHGDLATQYRAASAVVDIAPDSEWRFLLAGAARRVGCREEALTILRNLSPRSGWMNQRSPSYWAVRLDVRHLSDDPAGEARDASLALDQLSDDLFPGESYRAVAAQIRAAAISGSSEQLARRLGEARSLGRKAHMVWLKLLYWGPLNLDSDRPELQVILDSARAWYSDHPAIGNDAIRYRFAQRAVEYRARDWDQASNALDALIAAGWPPYPEYRFGPAAVLAARHGDSAKALAILDSLPSTNGHLSAYSDFDRDFVRARVAAILGEPAQAVEALRAANRRGIPYEDILGIARVDFEGMWDYPPLQRLLAEHSCEGQQERGGP